MMIKLLFLVLFIVFPFGQLTRLPLGIPGVNLYLHDLIISLILLTWLGQHALKKKKFKRPPLTRPIIGFAVAAFFSLLLAAFQRQPNEILIGSLYLVRWLAYSGIYFVVFERPRLHRFLAIGLMGAGIASALFGLLQYIFLPDTRFLYYSGWDDHYYRVMAPFFDPGFTGMIYLLALLLVLDKFWSKKSLCFLLAALVYLPFALTYSRSAYLAYLIGMGVIAWLKKSWKFFSVAFLVLVLTLLLLPSPGGEGVKLMRTSTIEARVQNYSHVLKIAQDHPLLGVGFNLYRYAQRDYGFLGEDWQVSHAGGGADSSLLFVWATSGLVGLFFYLWLLWEMVKIRPAATLTLIVHSFFNHSLFYPWIMLWIWIIISSSVLLPAKSSASMKILFSPSGRVKE